MIRHREASHTAVYSIARAVSDADISAVKCLLKEYAKEAGFELDLSGADRDFVDLQREYLSPDGCLLMCRAADTPAGCVGIRRLDKQTCELRRLFVRPSMRRHGIGRALLREAISEAQALGYRKAVLDTLETQRDARALYRSSGFVEVGSNVHRTMSDVIFMEVHL